MNAMIKRKADRGNRDQGRMTALPRTADFQRQFGRKQRRRARVQINVRMRSRAVLIGAFLLVCMRESQKNGLHLLRIQQLRNNAKVATELDEL